MTQPHQRWSFGRNLAFRFAFSYIVLYNFPPHGVYVPGLWRISAAVQRFWLALVPWVGRNLFGVDCAAPYQGPSGDRTFDFVRLLCVFVLAVAAAAAWSVADRKRNEYRKLHDWLRALVRYVLAANMINYGMVKVFKTQFPDLGAWALTRTYGGSSPMGLLWSFMGYSTAYTFFAGAGEFVGGILLFFRRTTTLGALIVIAVMSNVVMLNFCYDVPVKLFSMHLLAMAGFLILPDLRRLSDLLIFNRATAPQAIEPPFRDKRLIRAALLVKTLFIADIIGMAIPVVALYKGSSTEQAAPASALLTRGFHWISDALQSLIDKPRP